MTCPRCFAQFDHAPRTCPDCGVNLHHKISGIVKTSAVMISAGDENGFYDSVQEVPEGLRKRLIETTASLNSGTIVIADRAGKEQLTQILARRDSIRQRSQDRTSQASASSDSASGDNASGASAPDVVVPGAPVLNVARDSQEANPVITARRGWRSWIAWVACILILVIAAGIAGFFGLHW